MELHVIIPGRAPELVVRVVEGRVIIVPPPLVATQEPVGFLGKDLPTDSASR